MNRQEPSIPTLEIYMCGNFEEILLDFYFYKLFTLYKYEPKISKLTQFCLENLYLNLHMQAYARRAMDEKVHEKCEYIGN